VSWRPKLANSGSKGIIGGSALVNLLAYRWRGITSDPGSPSAATEGGTKSFDSLEPELSHWLLFRTFLLYIFESGKIKLLLCFMLSKSKGVSFLATN
jgi:hypothetical protein